MNLYGKLFSKKEILLASRGERSAIEKLKSLCAQSTDLKIKTRNNKAKIFRKHIGDWSRAVLIVDIKQTEESKGHFRFLRSTQFFFGSGITFLSFWILATLAMIILSDVNPVYWLFPAFGTAIFWIHRLFLKTGYKYNQKDIDRLIELLRTEFEIKETVNQTSHTTPASAPR